MKTELTTPLQQTQQIKTSPIEKTSDFFCCFHAKQFFDIEEEQIFTRIKSSIRLSPPFKEVLNDRPDLYGPFWIATTLIVIIIASSSLLNFFYTPQNQYNFNQLSVAAFLIYGIAFGCPYIIAIMAKIFGGTVSVVELICIYGYSLTSFLPVTALCAIHNALLQSIFLLIAFLFSTAFLVRGILSLQDRLGPKQRTVLSVFVIGVQILLVFMYKFYFFDLI